VKHWAGFPSEAIAFCLREARVQLSDVEHIAYNQDSSANVLRKISYLFRYRPKPELIWQKLRNRGTRMGFPVLFDRAFPGENMRAKLHAVSNII
jgi:carbamoyltransferase